MNNKKFVVVALNDMNIEQTSIKKELLAVMNKAGHELHLCDVCNDFMVDGYKHKETGRHYCSQCCLEEEYAEKNIDDLFECEIIEILDC